MAICDITPSGPVTLTVGGNQRFTSSVGSGFWTTDDVTVAVVDSQGMVLGTWYGRTNLKYWIGDSFESCEIIVE